jgi:UDP-N-acetylmuramoyl-tripeptide--D-alanyl-D-alanine ligase
MEKARVPQGRGGIRVIGGVKVIDSSYNSNPGSLETTLDFLGSLSGKKVAVLGDMLELGEKERDAHLRAGEKAGRMGLSYIAFVGKRMEEAYLGATKPGLISPDKARMFLSPRDALLWAFQKCGEGDYLLVKGSHSLGLSEALGKLAEEWKDD